MKYSEDIKATDKHRRAYLNSIENLIKKRRSECNEQRLCNVKNIIADPEKARYDFIEMLGWPLTETPRVPLSSTKELLSDEETYNIYRVGFETFPDFWFYGLLFEYKNKKLPLVISQHGGLGTPELCSGLYNGDTSNYNRMTERLFERGVHVFAPQLLIWNAEKYGVEYNRNDIDSKLKQLGGSIAALEIYCIRSVISYFERQPNVDGNRIGMAGHSYGGFYTLFTAAADTRIKTALSSSYFNDANEYSWCDFTWKNSAHKFLHSETALLCYPRKLWISVGEKDTCFNIDTAKTEYERLRTEIKTCGISDDWLNFEIYDADHIFCPDDKFVDDMIFELKK